jgi:hypothetical protein
MPLPGMKPRSSRQYSIAMPTELIIRKKNRNIWLVCVTLVRLNRVSMICVFRRSAGAEPTQKAF